MCSEVQQILAAVNERADDRTAELLPMLMARMAARDSLTGCVRCEQLLYPYVDAQIKLTRAKRVYNCDLWQWSRYTPSTEEQAYKAFFRAEKIRDEARTKYRSTDCTCWVTKRTYNNTRKDR